MLSFGGKTVFAHRLFDRDCKAKTTRKGKLNSSFHAVLLEKKGPTAFYAKKIRPLIMNEIKFCVF